MLLISLSLFAISVNARVDSYDIFTFTPQPGWQRADYAGNVQFTIQQGNSWAIVGLYRSVGTKGNAAADFEFDWNDLTRQYQLTGDVATEQNEVNGWQMILGTATGSIQGQQVNISVLTFSASTSHASIVLINNDFSNQLQEQIGAFMAGVSVVDASTITLSNSQVQYPIQTADNYSTPDMNSGISANSFPTPGQQPVLETIMMDDGWFVEATTDYVQYSRGDMKVIQYFFVSPEDPDSNLPDEDLFWRKFLASFFDAPNYTSYPNDPYDFLNKVESAWCYATYNPSGVPYFIKWIVKDGSSFLVITTNETISNAYFAHPDDIAAMNRYNNFPVDQQSIQGEWTSSNFGGAQMYEVNTGNYAGMSFASGSDRFTFSGNNLNIFSQGASGMVGTARTYQIERSGTFSVNAYSLMAKLTSRTDQMTNTTTPEQEQTWYYVAFRYAKNVKVLFMQNKQFTGLTYNLVRK
jgi:hypothetical protein